MLKRSKRWKKNLNRPAGSQKEKGEYRAAIKELVKQSKEAETLADDVAKYAKTNEDQEKAVETVLNGLSKTKGGFLQGINGIRKMTMQREDLEPKIEAHIKKLEGTVYAERFKDLANEIAILNNKKEDFTREFERCQVNINKATSTIGSRMDQMDAIDDSSLGLSGALDHSVYSALVSLDNESRAMLREQLYYFAKSYEYRTLKKVDPKFYKLDEFVKKLETFLKTDTSGKKVTLTEEQYGEIYGLLTARLRKFVKPLIKDLEKGRLSRVASWLISARQLVDEHSFQKLNTQQKNGAFQPLMFNLVKCGFGEPTIQKYRIVSFNLKEVKMANPDEAKRKQSNFELEFEHSGVSTLYDGNEFYKFRSQSEDEIIRWTFTCSVDSDGTCHIEPYTTEPRDIELIKSLLEDLCEKEKDVEQLSAPYRPGAFSDITLVRKKKGIMKERVEIEDFVLEAVLEGVM